MVSKNPDEPTNGIYSLRHQIRRAIRLSERLAAGENPELTALDSRLLERWDSGQLANEHDNLAEQHGFDCDVERWEEAMSAIRQEVLEQGFDAQRSTFVQHYDTTELDASCLLIPIMG